MRRGLTGQLFSVGIPRVRNILAASPRSPNESSNNVLGRGAPESSVLVVPLSKGSSSESDSNSSDPESGSCNVVTAGVKQSVMTTPKDQISSAKGS